MSDRLKELVDAAKRAIGNGGREMKSFKRDSKEDVDRVKADYNFPPEELNKSRRGMIRDNVFADSPKTYIRPHESVPQLQPGGKALELNAVHADMKDDLDGVQYEGTLSDRIDMLEKHIEATKRREQEARDAAIEERMRAATKGTVQKSLEKSLPDEGAEPERHIELDESDEYRGDDEAIDNERNNRWREMIEAARKRSISI